MTDGPLFHRRMPERRCNEVDHRWAEHRYGLERRSGRGARSGRSACSPEPASPPMTGWGDRSRCKLGARAAKPRRNPDRVLGWRFGGQRRAFDPVAGRSGPADRPAVLAGLLRGFRFCAVSGGLESWRWVRMSRHAGHEPVEPVVDRIRIDPTAILGRSLPTLSVDCRRTEYRS